MNTTPVNEGESPEPWVNVPKSATPDGALLELVRLADVVRWIMKTKRLHFAPAVRATHEALAGLENLALYLADHSGSARAVGADNVFGLIPSRRRIYSRGIDAPPAPPVQLQPLPDGVLPGQSAALYFVRNVWGNGGNPESIMDSEGLDASRLAMPCKQAAKLWGRAAVAALENQGPLTYAAMVDQRKRAAGSSWTEAQLNALRIEDEKRKTRDGVRKAIAKDLGLSVSQIQSLVSRDPKTSRKTAPSVKLASVQ